MFSRTARGSSHLVNSYLKLNKMLMSTGRHTGKVAIVTASTEGIGFAIANKLLEDGAKVMISSRKQSNVDKALKRLHESGVKEGDVKGWPCHVGDREQRSRMIEETLKEFGGIDILISNAAVNPIMGNIIDCPEEAFDKIMDINVKAALLLTQEVHPHMAKRKSGSSIVFISSIAGFQPISILGAYSVSKTALLGLNKVLSQELGPETRVNVVCPGIIETKFSAPLFSDKDVAEGILKDIPLKRFGKPEEIGGLVSFLCSDDASYITGESFIVSGGMPSRL